MNKFNPCEWTLFWPLIRWLSDDCQCCAIVRSLVVGIGVGLLIGVPWKWQIDAAVGLVLIVIGIVAAVFRTPLADDEEHPK